MKLKHGVKKMKKQVLIGILIAFFALSLTSSIFFNNIKVEAYTYSNTLASTEILNWYSMSSSGRTTFLNYVDGQNITHFILRAEAMYEWDDLIRDPYSWDIVDSRINNAENWIVAANTLGIEVSYDLHTWYTTWDTYFDDGATNGNPVTNRAAYIDYVEHVIGKFEDDGANVYSFMVLNEPQAQTASSAENNFINDIIDAAQAITDKPISVRFMGGYSPTTGHYASSIDTNCDYICRNTYWDARNPSQTVYGTTLAKLLTAISSAHSAEKEIWITEFGVSKSNLENQRSFVEAWVDWARSVEIDRIYCWVSRPESGSSENYNIWNGYMPNPAFYELTNPTSEADLLLCLRLNEGTGTIAYDESQYGNDGTIYGANWVNGKYGKALKFDGVNDKIIVPASSSLSPTSITVLVWCNLTNTVIQSIVVRKEDQYAFGVGSNSKIAGWVCVEGGWNGTWTGQGADLNDNAYHYLGWVYDNPYIKYYVDGEFVWQFETDGGNMRITGNDLIIGQNGGDYETWKGEIDELYIYDRALTDTEISELFSSIYNVVVLDQPNNLEIFDYYNIYFNYTPTFYQSIVNASLWANVSGTWQLLDTDFSVTNNTVNTINYTFSAEADYVWNVEVWNSTDGVWASSNRTFTIDLEEPEDNPPYYGTYSISTYSAGFLATFELSWWDDISLSHGWMEYNWTGSWINATIQPMFTPHLTYSTQVQLPEGVVHCGIIFYANDTIGQENNTEIIAFDTSAPTYYVTITINAPANTTYTSSSISINFSTSTNGTLDSRWFNIKNGSNWLYTNQSYSSATSKTISTNGTYTFYSWASIAEGESDSKNVTFTVAITEESPGGGGSSGTDVYYRITFSCFDSGYVKDVMIDVYNNDSGIFVLRLWSDQNGNATGELPSGNYNYIAVYGSSTVEDVFQHFYEQTIDVNFGKPRFSLNVGTRQIAGLILAGLIVVLALVILAKKG
jgi:hypothetical protein